MLRRDQILLYNNLTTFTNKSRQIKFINNCKITQMNNAVKVFVLSWKYLFRLFKASTVTNQLSLYSAQFSQCKKYISGKALDL